MFWSILLIIVGLFFIGNAAYEGGVHVVYRWIKKDDGHKADILLSLCIGGILIFFGHRIGFSIFQKSPIFTIMILETVIAVYTIIRNYFARIQ